MSPGNPEITKQVEEDIKHLDIFTIELTKEDILDLITILTKEYEGAGKLLTKFAEIVKESNE